MPRRRLSDEEEEQLKEDLEEEEIIEKWEETHPEQSEEPQETEETEITEEQRQAWIEEAEREELTERKKALLDKLEKARASDPFRMRMARTIRAGSPIPICDARLQQGLLALWHLPKRQVLSAWTFSFLR